MMGHAARRWGAIGAGCTGLLALATLAAAQRIMVAPGRPHANFRGIADEHGRLMVVMTHNTDIADTWEREGENREYFERFSPDGYAIGVNVIIYAMTH